jgi:hypothetical protein
MDDRELIAVILMAGMLPTLPIPRNRAEGGIGRVTEGEGDASATPSSLSIGVKGARGLPVRGASRPRHPATIAARAAR